MEEEINHWPTGKVKALEELIAVIKERDVCKIEICDLGKKVCNHKQLVAHSSKEQKKCAFDVQSKADTIQEENTRLLYQVNMMKKKKLIGMQSQFPMK